MTLFEFHDGEIVDRPGKTFVDLDSVITFQETPIKSITVGDGDWATIHPARTVRSVTLSNGDTMELTKPGYDRLFLAWKSR